MPEVCIDIGVPPAGRLPVPAPALAICGFSGSGKTTLLEAAIPRLIACGLAIAVIKHDAHGFTVDKPGKDSDRLFRAGATVALRGPGEQFQRRLAGSALSLFATIADLARHHDLVLVEGHKDTPLPKIWLEDASRTQAPSHVTNLVASLQWDSERVATFLKHVNVWLNHAWQERPLYLGIFMRPRSAEELALHELSTLTKYAGLDKVLTLGGDPIPPCLGHLMHLPDAPEFDNSHAALIAAHRWAPQAAWIVATWDACRLECQDIASLKSLRRPGKWAVTQRESGKWPALALYEPELLAVLEQKLMEEPGWNEPVTTLISPTRTLRQ